MGENGVISKKLMDAALMIFKGTDIEEVKNHFYPSVMWEGCLFVFPDHMSAEQIDALMKSEAEWLMAIGRQE